MADIKLVTVDQETVERLTEVAAAVRPCDRPLIGGHRVDARRPDCTECKQVRCHLQLRAASACRRCPAATMALGIRGIDRHRDGARRICTQLLVSAMKLAAYVGFPGDHVNIVYSAQDEFGGSFRQIFNLIKTTTVDGRRLGVLEFQDMRSVPGLQLADLVAYEMRHYYQLRQDKPHLTVRYPFKVLCDHQVRLKGGLFKFLPQWLMRLKITGGSTEVLHALFRAKETWAPLIRQLAPEPINLVGRSDRLVTAYDADVLDRLRSWQLHSDYEPDLKA